MALDVLFIVRNPFQPDRHSSKISLIGYFIASFPPAIVLLLQYMSYYSKQSSNDCSTDRELFDANNLFARSLSGVDSFAIVVGGSINAMLVGRLRSGLAVSRRSRQRVTNQLVIYYLGYSIANVGAIVSHMQANAQHTHIVLSARGLWELLVWCAANQGILCPYMFRRRPWFAPFREEVHVATLSVLSRVTDAQGASTAARPTTDRGRASPHGVQLAELSSGCGWSSSATQVGLQHNAKHRDWRARFAALQADRLDLAEELRYELVTLTAHGISKCISQSWREAVGERTVQEQERASMVSRSFASARSFFSWRGSTSDPFSWRGSQNRASHLGVGESTYDRESELRASSLPSTPPATTPTAPRRPRGATRRRGRRIA